MKRISFIVVYLFSFFAGISQDINYDQLPLNEKIRIKENIHSAINYRQSGPGNQIFADPEQDCNSAIPVCQNTYTQSQSYSGVGNNDEIPANSSCLGSNEKNSVWYIFTVSASGNLAFNVTPNNLGEDYDFALYEITNGGCAGIDNGSTTPVRCNFSATGGVTGLSASGSNASEPASGPNQSTVLPVTVGQTYVLVLSNYSSSQNGYTLNFAPSTASIFDVTPPSVLSTYAACGATTITVKFTEQVLCSSISANGSEFTITGTGGPYTVTAASGINCGNATNEVQLTLNTALSGAGPWTVSVGMGSDGNTLIDNCGNALSPPQTNVFNTSPAAATISGDNNICKGQTMALTASAGTSYLWAGPGTAGQTTNQTISVPQNSPGTFNYTVTVGNGSCGNSTANISVTVNDGPTSHFTTPVTICAGQSVTFTNTSAIPCTFGGTGLSSCNCNGFTCLPTPLNNGNLIHNWSFGDPLSGVDNFSTDVDAVHTFNTPGTYNVNLNVFFILFGGCSTNETHVVNVLPGATPPTAIASPTTICPGASSTLTASGGTTYTWTGPSGFNSTSNPVSVTPAATSTYTVSTPGCSGANTATVTVTVSTGTLSVGPIIGNSAVCPNATAVTYSVTNNAGSTYAWTVPAGASITAGQGTNAITVNFGASGGNVAVTETAACGNGNATLAISVNSTPVTSAITGPASVCPNATAITYSVTNTSGSTYAWTVPAGATITSGQTTNSITVDFGATGGNVSVTETSPCGVGTPVTIAVTTSSTPTTPPITGSNAVCAGSTTLYSVTNTVGSTYTWTVPAGAVITSAPINMNTISVDWTGSTSGTISVVENSACGSGTTSTFTVAIINAPVVPTLSGTSIVCQNATAQTYSVTNNVGSTYTWTVTGDATIASGQSTNQITVNFGVTAGSITIREDNACGFAQFQQSYLLTAPPATPVITGPASACVGTNYNYTVANNAGSTYTWTVPAGATIVSGQGTNSLTVSFGASGGNVGLTETNSCGTANDVQAVTINTTPTTPAITGSNAVCAGSTTLYSVTNTPGNTYAWTLPAGAVITSVPTNANSVSIDWTGSTGGTLSVVESSTCGAGTTSSFTVAIINAPVVPTLVGTFTICQNATAQTYSVTNHIGSTYTWTVTGDATITSGQSTNQITVNFGVTAGTITIREDNTCGFAQFQQSYLLTPPPATPVITGPTAVCTGTNYTYSVTNNPPSTYTWVVPSGATIVSGQGTNSITVSYGANGGNVSVTENGTCGNTASAPYAVSLTPAPTTPVITGSLMVCENATGIPYSVINHAGSTYSWTATGGISITSGANTNAANANFTTAGGTLTLTETNSCGNASASITINTSHITINAASASICPGFSTNITASGASTYTWTPAGGLNTTSGANVIANPALTTVYTINGTDAAGCLGDTTLTVTLLPPLTITLNASTTNLCSGTTATINASGATTYTWSPAATLSASSGASVTANPTVTTVYTVAGATPTCAGTNTISITVTPEPIISLTPNSVTICEGDSALVIASGATSYAWAPNTNFTSVDPPNNTSVIVYPPTTTTYTVIGTTNGCNNSAMVDVTVLPKITPLAGPNDTICFGQSTTLLGIGGQTYSWFPTFGLATPTSAFTTAQPFVTTDYILTASYNGLCAEKDTVKIVVNPLPTVYAGHDTTIDVEDVVILNGFSSTLNYAWLNGSTLNCTNCLSPTASPLETTTYILTATNQYGCTYSDTVTIDVSQEYALYVPTAVSPNDDAVNEGWKPQGFGIKKIQIWVFDRWGTKIFEAKDLNTSWNGAYKNDVVQQDVYVYKIMAETYSGNKFTKVGHVTVVR